MGNKFYLSKDKAIIGGVCAGLSEYIGMDVTVVRVLASLLLLSTFPVFFLYIFTWIIAPEK